MRLQLPSMKPITWLLLLIFSLPIHHQGQIITPFIKANFGVDADLRCNYFNNLVQSGNDDWFKLPATSGTGQFIIDTTLQAFSGDHGDHQAKIDH